MSRGASRGLRCLLPGVASLPRFYRQRGVSTPIAPRATAAAVEVRSTVGPSRTGAAPAADQRVEFLVADAALGPDHQHHRRRLAPEADRGQRFVGRLVQHQRPARRRRPRSRSSRPAAAVDSGPAMAGIQVPPRLPGGRAGHRPPAAQPLLRAVAVPAGHTPGGLPGDELVGAGLGGQLDRPVRSARTSGCAWTTVTGGLGRRRRRGGPAREPSGCACRRPPTTQSATAPAPSEIDQCLAGPDPPHRRGVETLVTVDDGELADRRDSCRRRTGCGHSGRQRPVKVSRSRLNSPPPRGRCGGARATSPRPARVLRLLDLGEQFARAGVELGRHHDLDVGVQVAADLGPQSRHAVAAQRGHRAGLGARGDGDLGGAVEDARRR